MLTCTKENHRQNKGYTLIELLVTISIIGVLSTIGGLVYFGAQKQSRDSIRLSKVTVISESLEKYYQSNGVYPSCSELTQEPSKVSTDVLKGMSPDSLTAPGSDKGTNSISCSGATTNAYYYDTADSDGRQYTLTYIKEETNQPEIIKSRYQMAVLGNTTIRSTGADDNSISLNWDTIEGASIYKLQRATDDQFQNDLYEDDISALSTTQTGLTTGTKYYFKVIAKSFNASSDWSNHINATTTVSPPTNPDPIVTTNTIGSATTYSWTSAVCASGASAQYKYRYTINNGFDSGLVTTANTSVTFTTANEGYTFTVSVQSQCYTSMAYSIFSGPGSASYTRPITAPSAPVVAVNTIGITTTWSWPAVVCTTGDTVRYQYQYTIDNGYDSGLIGTSNNSVAFTTSNQGYTFTVTVWAQCYNAYSSSGWSTSDSESYRRPFTYTLNTIAGTGGSVSGGGSYLENSNVTITATANTGYTFSSWSGDTGCAGSISHAISVSGNLSCTANFNLNNYTITLNTSGSGSYINCAVENANCTFTGTSNVRYGAYSNWSYKYGITSIACTNANFGDPLPGYVKACQYQAPVSVSGAGSFAAGSSRTITASPSGSFDSWTGGAGCSGAYSHSFTLNANTTCTANFSNHTVDLPTPPPAPSAPSISASFISNNAVLTVNAISCSSGTPEYKIRYLRQKYSSDNGWTAWTAWSTTRSMTQVAQQGNNHNFEVIAHCNSGGTYSLESATASTNIIMDIGTPAAPTYAGPGWFNSDVSQVVNFTSYCPSNTDLVNGTFVSNLSSTGNIWGPHPFGYSDYWTNWEGYTLTATYWGTYQCQTSFRASPVSPQGVVQVPVYSG